MANSRFHKTTAVEIQGLVNKTRNSNTDTSTKTWVNTFSAWAKERGKPEDILYYTPEVLNEALCQFYAEIRKKDGTEYEPDCLRVMRSGLDRYLKENKYPKSLLKDDLFKECNTVLEGKARELRDNGKGNRPNRALALTKQEEEILWDCGQLGAGTPRAMLNTLWLYLTQHFGLRGRQEHYPMMITDFVTGFDDEGNEYFTFSERRTKTRNEGLKPKAGQKKPKMFATSGPRCIVQLSKQYKLRRPEQLRNTGKFYLQPINNPVTEVWFKILPMGKNSIGDLMKEMKLNSPLKDLCPDKRLTNHTARKTVVKKLQSQGVQRSDIISITGHTTTRGLDAYDEGDNGFQRVLSNMIDGTASSSSTSVQAPSSTCSMTMSRPNLLNTERRSPAVLQSSSLPETSLPLQPIQLQNLSSNYQYLQRIPPLPTTRFASSSAPYQRQFQSPSFARGPIIQPPSFTGGPINLQTFNISNCNVTISAPAQPDTKKPRYDAFEIDPDLDFSLFTELLN